MDEVKSFFIKIDEFFFQKLDILKNDTSFQKLNDLISNLEEDQQKIFTQIITFIFIFIPFFIVIAIWWGNVSIKKNIEVKTQLLEQIETLDNNKNTLSSLSNSYLSLAIQGKEDLVGKISSINAANAIDPSKVQVLDFNQIDSSSNLTKVEAKLSFKKFGTQDFSKFMKALVENEKFKINKVDLEKDTGLLSGTISVIHLGKNSFN